MEWQPIETAPKDGRVWLVSRTGQVKVNERPVKQHISSKGYKKVCIGPKTVFVHRLVAQAFIQKIEGLNEVNHINGLKQDNSVENLEWCNRSQNMKHAYANGLHKGVILSGENSPNWRRNGNKHPQSIPVMAIFSDGSTKIYQSQGLAKADGFDSSKISLCINGKRLTHGGARWMPLPPPPKDEA